MVLAGDLGGGGYVMLIVAWAGYGGGVCVCVDWMRSCFGFEG